MRNDKKKKTKLDKRIYSLILIAFSFGVIISIASSYALAETLIKSADVSYVDNSKLGATNVQAAIDGTCTKFSNELSNFLNKIYPVGSIYISTANTNPSTFLGGTWENYADGRVLKGIKSGTAGTTGGSSTVTLSMSNIPAHTHDISHTHTTPKTTTSTLSLTAQADGSAHQHTLSSAALSWPSGADPNIAHEGYLTGGWGTGTYFPWNAGISLTGINGAHTHNVTGNVTIPAMTTDSISTTTSGSAGSSNPTAISVQDPYITVYMWRRTK